MKFIQQNCVEGDSVDPRQANAVLRHAPDLIIFEAPRNTRSLGWPCNGASLTERKQAVKERKQMLRNVARTYPWVWSEALLLDNVATLWESGHHLDLYDADAPSELLRETINNGWNRIQRPRRRGVHFPWWVYIYLRERMMANNITKIVARDTSRKSTALVAMQKFHWLHVQFLLSHPAKSGIFRYYFGAFSGVSLRNINRTVYSVGNPVLQKYWDRVSDFAVQ